MPEANPAPSLEAGSRQPLRIAIFGFGTVGSSVARILVDSKPEGLELTHVFNRGVARKRADWAPAPIVWSEDADSVLTSDVDVIVELAGGLDPAGTGCAEHWKRAKASSRPTKNSLPFTVLNWSGWPRPKADI